MVAPPSAPSLEGGDQIFNGGEGQDGGFGAGFGGEIGRGDWDEPDLAWEDFDLTMTNVTRQAGEPGESHGSAVEGMRWISDGDFTLALLCDQRGITLGEVSRSRGSR